MFQLQSPFTLKQHQENAIAFGLNREKSNAIVQGIRGTLFVVDMGLGKTLITLSIITRTYEIGAPTLIIVPKILLMNWYNEFQKFFGPHVKTLLFYPEYMEPKTLFYQITAKHLRLYHIVVTTYETISLQSKKMNQYLHNGIPIGPALFFTEQWFRIVVDESHVFANPKSTYFLALMTLKGTRKISLTGTPIRNYDSDMFAQMRFLGLTFEEKKKWSQKLFDKLGLQQVVFSLKLHEAGIDLPKMHDIIIDCQLNDIEKSLYDKYTECSKELYKQFKSGSKGGKKKSYNAMLVAVTRWRQICVSCHLLPPTDVLQLQLPPLSSKILQVGNILKKIEPNEKIIIFSNWVSALRLISKLISPLNTILLTGKAKAKERDQAFIRFHTDNQIRYLLITYKVGNVGLNLTYVHHMILLEPWYSGVLKKQAQARIHRIGQTKDVFIYNLLVPDSIESKIIAICHKKSLLEKGYLKHTRSGGSSRSTIQQEEEEEKESIENENEEAQLMQVLNSMFT